jgi:hypothetical protein
VALAAAEAWSAEAWLAAALSLGARAPAEAAIHGAGSG